MGEVIGLSPPTGTRLPLVSHRSIGNNRDNTIEHVVLSIGIGNSPMWHSLPRLLSGIVTVNCYYCLYHIPIMSSSNLYRPQNGNGFGASTNRSSTPTNFTGLLARSEALGANNSNQDSGNSSELPQIHYGIGEIERQSEMVAGKGKRKAVRGEG